MPNWCSNALVVRAGVDTFRRFALRNGTFQLKYSVPMPEALEMVNCGSRELNGEKVRVWRDTPEGPLPVDSEPLIAAYGHDNWYDWAIANWGSKWDVSEPRVEDRGSEVWVWFDTPWGPPLEWLQTATAQRPEWSGELAYAEGGMGLWGVVRFGSGTLFDTCHNEGFWDDPAPGEDEDEDDVFPDLSDAVREHLDQYGLHEGG